MMFLVIAKDAGGPDTLSRRQRVRNEHLRNLEPYIAGGQVILGGAILDDTGKPCGSALVTDFETREALEVFLQADLYTREGVWESFEIHPFRRAV
jgi:uncharacterized protein YciI